MNIRHWWFIQYAPWAEWVEVILLDGTICEAHYARDLSGEEQPPFQGWFTEREGCSGYFQIKPILWRYLNNERDDVRNGIHKKYHKRKLVSDLI